jgi:hypothetical protein
MEGTSNSVIPMEGGDLKLVVFKVGRHYLGKTKLSRSIRRKPKS